MAKQIHYHRLCRTKHTTKFKRNILTKNTHAKWHIRRIFHKKSFGHLQNFIKNNEAFFLKKLHRIYSQYFFEAMALPIELPMLNSKVLTTVAFICCEKLRKSTKTICSFQNTEEKQQTIRFQYRETYLY